MLFCTALTPPPKPRVLPIPLSCRIKERLHVLFQALHVSLVTFHQPRSCITCAQCHTQEAVMRCTHTSPLSCCPHHLILSCRIKERLHVKLVESGSAVISRPMDWRALGVPEWLADRAERLGFLFPTGVCVVSTAALSWLGALLVRCAKCMCVDIYAFWCDICHDWWLRQSILSPQVCVVSVI
jgi:hypothetical protein